MTPLESGTRKSPEIRKINPDIFKDTEKVTIEYETGKELSINKARLEEKILARDIQTRQIDTDIFAPIKKPIQAPRQIDPNIFGEGTPSQNTEGNAEKDTTPSSNDISSPIVPVEEKTEVTESRGWYLDNIDSDSFSQDIQDILEDGGDITDTVGDFASSITSRVLAHTEYLINNPEERKAIFNDLTNSKAVIGRAQDDQTEFKVTYGGNTVIFADKDAALNRINQLQDLFNREDISPIFYPLDVLQDAFAVIFQDILGSTVRITWNATSIVIQGIGMMEDLVLSWDTGDVRGNNVKDTIFILAQVLAVVYAGFKLNRHIGNVLSESRTGSPESVRENFADNLKKMQELKEKIGVSSEKEAKLFKSIIDFQSQTAEGNLDSAKITSFMYKNLREVFHGNILFTKLGQVSTDEYTTSHLKTKSTSHSDVKARKIPLSGKIFNVLNTVINKNNEKYFPGTNFRGWRFISKSNVLRTASTELGYNVTRFERGLNIIDLSTDLSIEEREALKKKYGKLFNHSTVSVDIQATKFLRKNLSLSLSNAQISAHLSGNIERTPEIQTSIEKTQNTYIHFVENHPEINDVQESKIRKQINFLSLFANTPADIEDSFGNVLKEHDLNYSYEQIQSFERETRSHSITTQAQRDITILDANEILNKKDISPEDKVIRLKKIEQFLDGDKTFYSKHFVAIIDLLLEGGEYNSATTTMTFDDIKENPPYVLYIQQKKDAPNSKFHTGNIDNISTPSLDESINTSSAQDTIVSVDENNIERNNTPIGVEVNEILETPPKGILFENGKLIGEAAELFEINMLRTILNNDSSYDEVRVQGFLQEATQFTSIDQFKGALLRFISGTRLVEGPHMLQRIQDRRLKYEVRDLTERILLHTGRFPEGGSVKVSINNGNLTIAINQGESKTIITETFRSIEDVKGYFIKHFHIEGSIPELSELNTVNRAIQTKSIELGWFQSLDKFLKKAK